MRSVRAWTVALTGVAAAAVMLAGATATSAKTVTRAAQPPRIERVLLRFNGAELSATIFGTGFGVLRHLPRQGDLPYFSLRDVTRGWQAGDSQYGNRAHIDYIFWDSREIRFLYSNKTDGRGVWVLKGNDRILLRVENPVTHLGAVWRGRISQGKHA